MSGVDFRGFRADKRSVAMIKEAEWLLNSTLRIAQGSYHKGTAASAGTHDGGGAFDFVLTGTARWLWFQRTKKVNKTIRVLRTVGFAAWYRSSKDGPWSPHIHCIAVDCPDSAPLAKNQVAALRRGENGLKNRGKDPHHDLNLPVVDWEHYQHTHHGHPAPRLATPVAVTPPAAAAALAPGDAIVKELLLVKPGKRTLRPGMSGTDVEFVQRKIGKTRCGAPDGVFGPKTTAGVRAYQRARHLSPTGVVGPVLWKRLL